MADQIVVCPDCLGAMYGFRPTERCGCIQGWTGYYATYPTAIRAVLGSRCTFCWGRGYVCARCHGTKKIKVPKQPSE